MRKREELKFAVMECGGLFTLEAGTAVMLLLSVGNWDFTNHIQVYLTIYILLLAIAIHESAKFSSLSTCLKNAHTHIYIYILHVRAS